VKQGTGNSTTGAQKREPISHAINPAGASAIGQMYSKNVSSLDAGRGFMSPEPAACTCHESGSQGKHK